jgi:hypothetical protein
MDFSAHIAAVLGFFPFIVVVPAAVAIISNRIKAAKRRPGLVYTSCTLLTLFIALLLSRFSDGPFKGVDFGVAGVLAALCFVFPYLRVTNILTKGTFALLWREIFLVSFAAFNLYFAWTDWKSWGYIVMALLCLVSVALLWRSSALSKYPLYAASLFLVGTALVGGIYNYIHQPALLQSPIKFQIISWLIPGIPSVLLINCCIYARRVGRGSGTRPCP